MAPLFDKLIDIAGTCSPRSVPCFNTGPGTTVDTVRRWWPQTTSEWLQRTELEPTPCPAQISGVPANVLARALLTAVEELRRSPVGRRRGR